MPSRPPATPQRRLLAARTKGLLALGLLVAAGWQVLPIGWFSPLVVQDVSMAPTLLGQHAMAVCPRCGLRYPIEWLPDLAADSQSTCAGCGRLHPVGPMTEVLGGDRVWIERLARWSGPRRGQLWAFRDREAPRRWLVKRVVGLPGERIDLRHGDLLVDEQPQPKSLEELREVSIPVTSFRGGRPGDSPAADGEAPGGALSWRPADGSAWRADRGGWNVPWTSHDRQSDELESGWQWLEFQGTEVVGRQGAAGLLLDDYSFHQSVSRSLHPMSDLWLSLEVELSRPTPAATQDPASLVLAVEWRDAWQACRAEWDWGRREVRMTEGVEEVCVEEIGGIAGVAAAPREFPPRDLTAKSPLRLVFAAWDGQAAAGWLDRGRMSMVQGQLRGQRSGPPTLRQLRVGVRGGVCRVGAIELRRDLYLYDARREAGAARGHAGVPVALGAGQFFLLGDNGPQSIDSRDYGPVSGEQLVGRVRKAR